MGNHEYLWAVFRGIFCGLRFEDLLTSDSKIRKLILVTELGLKVIQSLYEQGHLQLLVYALEPRFYIQPAGNRMPVVRHIRKRNSCDWNGSIGIRHLEREELEGLKFCYLIGNTKSLDCLGFKRKGHQSLKVCLLYLNRP